MSPFQLVSRVLREQEIRELGISAIDEVVHSLRQDCRDRNVLGVLHSVVLGRDQSPQEWGEWNRKLSEAYARNGFFILGGDTSTGEEFSVVMTVLTEQPTPIKEVEL